MISFKDYIGKGIDTAKSVVNKAANTNIPVGKLIPGPVGTIAGSLPKQPTVTPKKLTNIVADATVRPVARVGFEATQTIKKDNRTLTPKTTAQKAILGTEPLRNYNDPNRTSAKIGAKVGAPKLGLPLAIAGAALDVTSLTPSGAGKNAARKGLTAVARADELMSPAKKFGTELQKLAVVAKNEKFAKDLRTERAINTNLGPKVTEGMDFIEEGARKLKRVGGKVIDTLKDEKGFINLGAKVGKEEPVEQGIKAAQDVSSKGIISQSTKPNIGTQLDPNAMFRDVMKTQKQLRSKQEEIYTTTRSERAARAEQAGQQAGGGEAGLYAELSAIEGKMDIAKNKNNTLRDQFPQENIDNMINQVNDYTDFDFYEKLATKKSIVNLFNQGKIPTDSEIIKIGKVFGEDTAKAILDTRSTLAKIKDGAVELSTLPRSLMSTLDVSAPLRQGIVPAATHPRDFGRNFKKMFGYAASQKKFDDMFKEIKSKPNYDLKQQYGLALTDMTGSSTREEAYASQLAEKIPAIGRLVKASGRGYTGFLDNFRSDLWDTLYKANPNAQSDTKFLRDMTAFVNNATGRGDLRQLGMNDAVAEAAPLLNSVFFSPRLIASRVSLMNPVYYAQMHPSVRKEAMKEATGFVVAGLSVLGAAKLAGLDVGTNPTSSDFGKIKVDGKTRYDIWGGFQQYAVLLSRIALQKSTSSTTGKVQKFNEGFNATDSSKAVGRFFSNKLAPIPSYALDAMKGEDAVGQPFDPVKGAVKRLTPMQASDAYEKFKEYGPLGPILSIPGLFGVGSQTYGNSTKKKSKPIGTRVI